MMEEKKKPGRKPAAVEEQQKKLSYDELVNVANQVSSQNRQLRQQLQQMNMANVFRRLDYLFKVVENGHMFSERFLGMCTDEIEEILKIPEDGGSPADKSDVEEESE